MSNGKVRFKPVAYKQKLDIMLIAQRKMKFLIFLKQVYAKFCLLFVENTLHL